MEIALKRGSIRPDAVTWVPQIIDRPPPEPSRPLGSAGSDLWRTIWEAGSWLQPADEPMALLACEAIDDRQAFRGRALKEQDHSSGWWRWARQARDAEKQAMMMLGDLGFSPSGRARLGLAVLGIEEGMRRIQEGRSAEAAEF
jgi:hypothetical protein